MPLRQPLPPPGWYADPSGIPGALRWWAGDRWGDALAQPGPWSAGSPPWPAPTPPGWAGNDGCPVASGYPGAASDAGPGSTSNTARPGEADPARLGRIPLRAVWWALLGLAAGEIAGGVLGAIAAVITGGSNSAAVTLVGEVGLWGGMAGACLFVSRRYGTRSLRRDLGLLWRPADLGWGPLATVAGLIVTALLSRPFTGTRLSGSNTQLITGQTHNTAGFAVIAVIVSIGAPLFEELFFRGLVRTALTTRFGTAGGIVGQAALFGLAHVNPTSGLGNIEVVVVIGAFGIVLGAVAHLTGRLGAGMIGHGLFNLLVTITVLTG